MFPVIVYSIFREQFAVNCRFSVKACSIFWRFPAVVLWCGRVFLVAEEGRVRPGNH